MKKPEGPGAALILFVILVALAFGTCVAVCDDEDDEQGISYQRSHQRGGDDDRDGDDRSTGKNSRGKCENAKSCQDDDFSPSFDDSPVILCLPSSTCNFGEGEAALPSNLDPRCAPFHCDPRPTSLMPPDPVKLMAAIQTFTKGVGEASGALAGAIAGGTIGILLEV